MWPRYIETTRLARDETGPPSFAAIIPSLNEERYIQACVSSLRRQPLARILVVDGGSRDQTRPAARAAGAEVVRSRPGRAIQSNTGARLCRQDVLLFVHADCVLCPGAVVRAQRRLRRDRHVGGFFRQRMADFPAKPRFHPLLRMIDLGADLRARLAQRPYGDQGMFVWRTLFQRVGGFPELPIGEEVVLGQRLAGLGRWLAVDAEIQTSARRFLEEGIVRRAARNWLTALRIAWGADPEATLAFYERRPLDNPRAGSID